MITIAGATLLGFVATAEQMGPKLIGFFLTFSSNPFVLLFFIMPIDLAHNEIFVFYQLGVSHRPRRDTRFYEPIKKLPFPETSVEPITDFG